jgi:Rrf2 family protein
MRMSEGVEWAVHSCLVLAWVGDGESLSTARLASTFELPPAYLNKQLQALAKAGIVRSTPGPRGGFRLARRPESISMLDVVTAIEGPDEPFQCQEIRQRGIGATVPKKNFREQCAVAAAMRTADVAWRAALAAQSLADVRDAAERTAPHAQRMMREWHRPPQSSGT